MRRSFTNTNGLAEVEELRARYYTFAAYGARKIDEGVFYVANKISCLFRAIAKKLRPKDPS